ncbi:MAG TPA: phosphotransferase family protein [Baekduia sp.]|uniref:phosphotransferase family protein n=1 Tax=Baekduia sp. TaxID=2600305 RepID=UPI002D793D7A|nr:phosphotransferase family protein [Baekduia sp.]HET6507956.1 phosphotransferase family protein [Baekduia sp.]
MDITRGWDFASLDDPPPELIEELRRRYPVERETDRQLVRKLRRRGGAPYAPVSLQELSDAVARMLEDTIDGPFSVSDARWFTGGASKVQMGFVLEWEDGGRPRTDRLMVRMDPAESHNATSKLREFELLRALDGRLPVPEAFWVDDDARWFPYPALVYALIDGVAKPSRGVGANVAGLGTNFGPGLRERLAPQYLEYLARIHTLDLRDASLPSFDVPAVGTTQSALWELNRARRLWEEDRGVDVPLMEVAAGWLERTLPTLDHVSLVHGDYRSGNFLFDEGSARITGWLDWERAHLGDRHRDLAWSTQPVCGHYAEDGRTYLVCGLVPLDEFYDRYSELSGLEVDPERLRWYRVLNAYSMVASTVGSAWRVARLGKTHQDILLARVEGMRGVVLEELRTLLEDVR